MFYALVFVFIIMCSFCVYGVYKAPCVDEDENLVCKSNINTRDKEA